MSELVPRATSQAATAGALSAKHHLMSLDVVRVTTLFGVVTVHSVSVTLTAASVVGGTYLSVAHVTRSVFIGLSGFVLTYRAGSEPIRPRAFWRRRYVLVVVPYLVWTAVYVVADGSWGTAVHLVGRFALDVADGGARYHLYFLLLTFQLYAVYPWVLAGIRRCNPWPLLATSVALQLCFTAGTHWWSSAPGPMGTVLSHPGSWLWSYQLYVVVGVLAAIHHDAVTAWVWAHTRTICATTLAAVAVGIGSYIVQVELFSMNSAQASEVFQPSVTVDALAAMVALFALGLRAERGSGARWARPLRSMSDSSFGVYLGHPLVLQGILALAGVIGVRRALAPVPSGVQLALVLLVLAPLAYGVTTLAASALRHTPLSLAITGRRTNRAGDLNRPPSVPTHQQGAFHGLDLSRPAAPLAQTPG